VDLRGRVAVVTGASAGIGEATGLALANAGAKVVLTARRLERLESLAERIERAGGDALPSVVQEAFGPADVLVNNAGVPDAGDFVGLDYGDIERVIRVNVLGVMFGTRAFLPGMHRLGRGHVVNVASLAGRFAPPGASVYTASKHAVVAFSESLDGASKAHGVRITAVNPAFVDTEGFPQEGRPRVLTLGTDRVANAIVRVVREEIAPEYSLPRWVAPFEAFRILTPPLYRWAMGIAARTAAPR
jgi:NADP-dependent 3-hydroxy acid dehydrogenase YdfG